MIVRDEEDNLSHCLESVAGLFDEIVIVDTGSTDRTVEIARSFGARVFDFVWVDDFAAARNAALARATGDYAFWLDADDVVDPPEREKLEALLDRLRAGDEACYVVRCKCDPSPDGSGGETVVDHIRLFPLREDVRWTYRVHEQILPALSGPGCRCAGPTSPCGTPAMSTRRCGPGSSTATPGSSGRSWKTGPTTRSSCSTWGRSPSNVKIGSGALGFLKRSLAGSAPTDSITRKLFALIARAHQMLGDSQAALRTCAEGLSLDPEDAELWFRKAVVHRHRGESSEAERMLAADLDTEPARAVFQRRPGDLRASDPAQPGGAGRRARRSRRGREALDRSAGRMPGRPRSNGEAVLGPWSLVLRFARTFAVDGSVNSIEGQQPARLLTRLRKSRCLRMLRASGQTEPLLIDGCGAS